MTAPAGHHLAEFNFGILRHDWDDPRVADFAKAVAAVNRLAARSAGFIWQLPEAAMDAAQKDPDGVLGGNPRMASTLSVWEDGTSLRRFAFETVHAKYYARRGEWFAPETGSNLVMWWVPQGHRPTLAEGMARFQQWRAQGDSDHAFGWAYLEAAGMLTPHACVAR